MLLPSDVKIYFYGEPTDMRKSIDTLSILIADVLQLDPASGHLFIFRNRQRNKLKALFYEQNCFTLWYRRLESGKFIIPKDVNGHIEMTKEHFDWLLASDKYSKMDALKKPGYDCFY